MELPYTITLNSDDDQYDHAYTVGLTVAAILHDLCLDKASKSEEYDKVWDAVAKVMECIDPVDWGPNSDQTSLIKAVQGECHLF